MKNNESVKNNNIKKNLKWRIEKALLTFHLYIQQTNVLYSAKLKFVFINII